MPIRGGVGRDMATLDSPSLGKLLLPTYPYVIPEYQRPFSWSQQSVVDFVSDLYSEYESIPARGGSRPLEPYFFGAVITLECRVGHGEDDRVYEVVDGQQRLTAFYITVAELRRAFASLEEEAIAAKNPAARKSAHNEFLTMDKRLYVDEPHISPRRFRLTPGGVEAGFYAALLTDGDVTSPPLKTDPASHQRLYAAVHIIRDELVGKARGEGTLAVRLARLVRLRQAILEASYVIHASSATEAEAYRLFEALNDRGTPLTEADLLRTKTMAALRAYPDEQQRASKAWDVIVRSTDPKRFLQAFFGIQTGKRPQSAGLHRQYMKQGWIGGKVANRVEAEQQAAFVEELAADFKIYAKLAAGDWPFTVAPNRDWDRNRLVRLVRVTRQQSTLPLLLALAHGPEQRFIDSLRFLDRFAFRYVVCDGHPSRVADAYIAQASLCRADIHYGIADLRAALAPLAQSEASDETFVARLAELDYGSTGSALIRHFLTTLDDYDDWYRDGHKGLPAPSTVKVWDLKTGDIDHIYPQTPKDGYDDPSLEPVKHNLGNLAYLEDKKNRGAGNDPFAVKQATVYSLKGQAVLTRELADMALYPLWTRTEFESRQADLLARALAVFRV